MQVKIFRAANLQAALEEIREQLGPHASVLKTRQCRDGWMGWLGRSYVEVTATCDADFSEDSVTGATQTAWHEERSGWTENDPAATSTRPLDSRHLPRLWQPTARLPSTGSSVSQNESSFDPKRQLYDELISLGVSPTTAERWLRSAGGFAANLDLDHPATSWQQQLQHSVARELRVAGPIQLPPGQRRVVALVGPTGVGKTTTVAKLAAGFRMGTKRRVGLLTIDTFRIAAVQQLQAYAQIMDLPMAVVESEAQMDDAITQLGDVDLILIDTAGRSPKGDMNIDSLIDLLQTARPDETHLVLSATSTSAVIRSAIEGFAGARPTAAIVSKLDETPYTAAVLSALASTDGSAGIPVSYITDGQHVPEDIAVANPEKLVERLLPSALELPQIEAA